MFISFLHMCHFYHCVIFISVSFLSVLCIVYLIIFQFSEPSWVVFTIFIFFISSFSVLSIVFHNNFSSSPISSCHLISNSSTICSSFMCLFLLFISFTFSVSLLYSFDSFILSHFISICFRFVSFSLQNLHVSIFLRER